MASTYIGIMHFGLEFCVFLMCFAISYITWQLYTREGHRSMMAFAFGFALVGLSGVIHSFNLSTEAYLGLMFVGRIGGYVLILWAVSNPHPRKYHGSKGFHSFFPFLITNPTLYVINALLTGSIAYQSYRDKSGFKPSISKNITWSFILIAVSELLFSFSQEGRPLWLIAHVFKLTGFIILTWTFLRFPGLRVVDKIHVVLRGLVLFSVIAVIIPVTLLMFYNIRQDALGSVNRDGRRIVDHMEKDKQEILRTAQAIAENPLIINLLADQKDKTPSPQIILQLRLTLRETGNDYLLIMDKNRVPVINLTGTTFQYDKLSTLWLVTKAYSGQRPVAIEDNFVTPLTIVSAIPVKKNGETLGIVITGLNITDGYLKEIKKSLQVDVNIYHANRLVASSSGLLPKERETVIREDNPEILKRVLDNKQTYLGETRFREQQYYTSYVPLFGPQQRVLGMIFTGISANEFEYRKSEILAILIVVAIPVTLLAWYIGTRLSRKITQSVEALGYAAQQVTEGNLDVTVSTISGDELADLGRLFNQMTAKLKEIDIMKSDFYSFISHEIRTPLTALKGASESMVEIGTESFSQSQRKMLQIIIQNSQRLSRLVDNLLELAKLEAGKMSFAKVPVDMNAVIAKSVETFVPVAKSKNISLQFTPQPELPKPVGDSDWLTQVMNNLVNNAIKFTPDQGQVTVAVESRTVQARENGNIEEKKEIVVRVRDTGIGIPHNELEHIFDKYHQVQSSLSEKLKGTGLGLSICKHVIEEAHHGKIWAESEEGKGSVFVFTIPMEEENKTQFLV